MNPAKTIRGEFIGVQALRFVAAALVLVAHITITIAERMGAIDFGVWDKGGVGVKIFFVISGFVMIVSSQRLREMKEGSRIFMLRRIVRIVPLYWLTTTLKLGIVLAVPAYALHSAFDLKHVILSYVFLPARNVEGEIKPLHALGWTLTYEMFFYCAFAIALFFRKSPTLYVSVLFLVLVFVGLFADFSTWPAIVVYLHPIILLFIFGMLIGHLCIGDMKPPNIISMGMIIFGIVAIALFDDQSPWLSRLSFSLGIPAVCIVAGTAFLEPQLRNRVPQILHVLGDSSYAIYLIHPFVVAPVGIVLFKLGLHNPWLALVVMLIATLIVGCAIFRWIERPTTRYLRSRFHV